MRSPAFRWLLALEGGLAFALAGLCAYNILESRELNRQAWILANFQQRQRAIAALGMDAVAYSRQNPAIDPLLAALGLKAGVSPTQTAPAAR